MTKKVLAIVDYENICFKCLEKKEKIETFSIYRNSYGSSFDNNHTELNICNECKPVDLEKWFDEEPEKIEYYTKYKYEKNIIEFVDTFPLEGQELFWNRCASGACADVMNSQDWIDDKLGILPDEVYEEEYNMYSPRQIKAYEERFPTCEHPVNAVFNDKSKGCYCPFGASGNYGQEADINISEECYGCQKYKKRETKIKEMSHDTYKKYEVYIQGKEFEHLFE
ncbi:hypothetical protein [Metabacillus fastidiosus]|uniref:hypothetical protein n=1 Tax=Metabacillus fastidiosus TaxID=1458 RepID=UPI003D2AEC9F